MDARCCAYSFLKEDSLMCDYEIMTDQLCSDLALARHEVKHCDELLWLAQLVYHCNGSIRGKMAISPEDLEQLNAIYERYVSQLGSVKMFVLPQGSKGACWLHHLRVQAKACVRLAYKIEKEGKQVEKRLLDTLNLLSNVLFQMALWENHKEDVAEIPFVSKSYVG